MRQSKTICWTLILCLPPFIHRYIVNSVRECTNTLIRSYSQQQLFNLNWLLKQKPRYRTHMPFQNNICSNTNWLYAYYAQWLCVCYDYDLTIVLRKYLFRFFAFCCCCYCSFYFSFPSFSIFNASYPNEGTSTSTSTLYTFHPSVYTKHWCWYGGIRKRQTFQRRMNMVMRTRVIDFIKSHSLQNRYSAFVNFSLRRFW